MNALYEVEEIPIYQPDYQHTNDSFLEAENILEFSRPMFENKNNIILVSI